jgi:uncharacterized protein (UPF0332 family)
MNFRSFLKLAETLAEGSTEAEWRTAISRAYYAAFHVACEQLVSLGFRVPHRSEQSHAYAWRRWSNAGRAEAERAGSDLNGLRSDRNKADYDRKCKINGHDAKDAVALARVVIAAFDAAGKEPLRKEVLDAMKAYERDVLKEVTWQA